MSSWGYYPISIKKKPEPDHWIDQSDIIRFNYGVVWKVRLTPEQKGIFTRLNNRKTLYSEYDFVSVGYECVMINFKFSRVVNSNKWCLENLGPKRYSRYGHIFFFLNKEDATFFKMSCV